MSDLWGAGGMSAAHCVEHGRYRCSDCTKVERLEVEVERLRSQNKLLMSDIESLVKEVEWLEAALKRNDAPCFCSSHTHQPNCWKYEALEEGKG
jgi:predicted RNase H-like nuclease (RuvC/YqgF family)